MFVQKPPSEARNAIIQAALECFAVKGIRETTTRDVTTAAGVGLGAVNYYFGSKLGLEYEVIDAVVRSASERRLAEYAALESRHSPDCVPVESIARALLRPYVEGEVHSRMLLVRVVQLHRFAPTPLTTEMMKKYFDGIALKTVEMLQRALPGVTRSDVFWRYHLALGAIQSVLRDRGEDNRLKRLSGGEADAHVEAELVEKTIEFVVGGICRGEQKAPAIDKKPTRRR